MTKLTISLKGDEYTTEQKLDMWTQIHIFKKCPECGAIDSMLAGPRGGQAINIMCSECKIVFWTTPIKGFGAYPVGMGVE